MSEINIQDFRTNGFLHLKNFFDKEKINSIKEEAIEIFKTIMKSKGMAVDFKNESEFNQALFQLFESDLNAVINVGKQIQHMIALHRLSVSEQITELLLKVGLEHPVVSTRPVLFFNHPRLAKQKHYYKVASHQDWRSMQGSLNSVVIWLPLMDIDISMGALKIVPKSHLAGLVANDLENGFGYVSKELYPSDQFIDVEVELGDALIFSSFLIHESGENVSDFPRWSCHFRYNDLKEKTFVERNYPHPYVYHPQKELINGYAPNADEIAKIFKND